MVFKTEGKLYELHYLPPSECKFIKFIFGFPPELIGEEMFNKQFVQYFHNLDETLKHSTFILGSQWENWFNRNKNEGFGYSYKEMGFYIHFQKGEYGKFIYMNEAFITWCGEHYFSYYQETSYVNALPANGIDPVDLQRGEEFCPIPIISMDWYFTNH